MEAGRPDGMDVGRGWRQGWDGGREAMETCSVEVREAGRVVISNAGMRGAMEEREAVMEG